MLRVERRLLGVGRCHRAAALPAFSNLADEAKPPEIVTFPAATPRLKRPHPRGAAHARLRCGQQAATR
jgi:hypothetical protein